MPYKEWRTALEEYVKTKGTNREPHALLPLFDLVTSNLPADTSSKLLDDSNTQVLLREYRSDFTTNHQAEVTSKTVHAYLRFMVGIGFLKPPSLTRDDGSQRNPLQRITMGQEQKEAFEQVGRVGTRAKIQWRERAANGISSRTLGDSASASNVHCFPLRKPERKGYIKYRSQR